LKNQDLTNLDPSSDTTMIANSNRNQRSNPAPGTSTDPFGALPHQQQQQLEYKTEGLDGRRFSKMLPPPPPNHMPPSMEEMKQKPIQKRRASDVWVSPPHFRPSQSRAPPKLFHRSFGQNQIPIQAMMQPQQLMPGVQHPPRQQMPPARQQPQSASMSRQQQQSSSSGTVPQRDSILERFVVRDRRIMQEIDRQRLPIAGYLVSERTLSLARAKIQSYQVQMLPNQGGPPSGSSSALPPRVPRPIPQPPSRPPQLPLQTEKPTIKVSLKSWNCSFCGKIFRSRSEYRRHVRVHTGERPFPCELCDARFKQKSHLKVHLRAHAKEQSRTTIFFPSQTFMSY